MVGTSVARTSCITFLFNDTTTPDIYTLSLHDALPILPGPGRRYGVRLCLSRLQPAAPYRLGHGCDLADRGRSEEHTSELQSRRDLVCRLLLEKKKTDARLRARSAHCPSIPLPVGRLPR